MPKRVVVLDSISREGLALLEAADNIEFDVRTGLAGDELRDALTEYDGAICRSGVTITGEVLDGNRRLKAIVRAGVGTDNIDKTVATRLGIIVMNTPTGNTISTAEHAFALMLAMSRNLAPAYQSLIEGRWDRKAYMGVQLAGKTLGIVGLGRIGQEIAERAQAFAMQVIGLDPFLSHDRAAELGVELVDTIRDMLPRVDYLTVHTPLTAETRNLIGAEQIEMMRPGARLINAARGGIYNEQALVEGLRGGKLAGVALDVFENEPCTDSPLFGMPGVLCTPHLGASTAEAQTQVAVEAVNLLISYLTTGAVRHAVNVAAIDPASLAGLHGFLNVAYRLGMFLSQCHSGGASACRLFYRGEIAQKETKLLTAAFCTGLLERALDEPVNIVNAEVLLRDRGIKLTAESRSEMGAFKSAITAELDCDGGPFVVGGTLFGNDMQRLFRLQDYRLEAYLDGVLLVFTHDDVPGIIGKIGTVFEKHNVNIAQMAVGRAMGEQPGGAAIGVLNLDAVPPQQAIDEILQHKNVHKAFTIELPPAGKLPAWMAG